MKGTSKMIETDVEIRKKKIKKRCFFLLTAILTAVILIEFIHPRRVYADAIKADEIEKNDDTGIGGVLFAPIQKLCLILGDAIMNLLALSTTGMDQDFRADWPILELIKSNGGAFIIITAIVGIAALLTGTVWGYIIAAGIGAAILASVISSSSANNISAWEQVKNDVAAFNIFYNQSPATDANFISPREYTFIKHDGSKAAPDEMKSSAQILHNIVKNWYNTLRYVAILFLLLVLVYLAIRMVISSSNETKAKYKENIIDWITAFCLLFFLHYFMVFANTLVETFADSLRTKQGLLTIPINMDLYAKDEGDYDKVASLLCLAYRVDNLDAVPKYSTQGGDVRYYPTDFMGYIRWNAQLGTVTKNGTGTRMAFTLMYLVLTFYSVYFFFIYLKRLLFLAFLTMISPLIAVTYPLDRLKDGHAQAFQYWLKEYTFNLVIQPVHLILYQLITGTAVKLAIDYPLFGVVAIGFLVPAEKIIKEMFGLNSNTLGNVAGPAAAGAMAGSLLSKANAQIQRAAGAAGKVGNGQDGGGSAAKKPNIRMDSNKIPGINNSPQEMLNGENATNAIQNTGEGNAYIGGDSTPGIAAGAAAGSASGAANNQNANTTMNSINESNQAEDMQAFLYQVRNAQNLPQGGGATTGGGAVTGGGSVTGGGGTTVIGGGTGAGTGYIPGAGTGTVGTGTGTNRVEERKPRSAVSKGLSGIKQVAAGGARRNKGLGAKLAKGAIKTTAALTLGGTGAMIGAAAGLASDDYKNVLIYGGAGAVGGYKSGGMVADGINNLAGGAVSGIAGGARNVSKDFHYGALEGANPDSKEYDEYLAKVAVKGDLKDADIRKIYRNKIGPNWKEYKDVIKEFYQNGITDHSTIAKVMTKIGPSELKGNKEKMGMAIAAWKAYDSGRLTKKQDREEFIKAATEANNLNSEQTRVFRQYVEKMML